MAATKKGGRSGHTLDGVYSDLVPRAKQSRSHNIFVEDKTVLRPTKILSQSKYTDRLDPGNYKGHAAAGQAAADREAEAILRHRLRRKR